MHARILGALCDALEAALSRVNMVQLDRLPRMADFAQWVTAAETALGWDDGTFLDAYSGNRAEAHEVAVETSLIGPALLKVADSGFAGTMSELLGRLEEQVGERASKAKDWPKSARGVRAELDRLAPNLRALGYRIEHDRDTSRGRARTTTISHIAEKDGGAK